MKCNVIAICLITMMVTSSVVTAEEPYQIAWSREWDPSYRTVGRSVAIDSTGNAFLTGWAGDPNGNGLISGEYGQTHPFLNKYDSGGNLLWTRQLGASQWSISRSVAVDSGGNAFISGYTTGSLGGTNAGDVDAFLAKYDPSGTLLWTKQLGTSSGDVSRCVAVDSSGNAFITGYTEGSMDGANDGSLDVFLRKYDSSGNLQWAQQMGTSRRGEVGHAVAVDSAGNAFITGHTYGSMGGTNAGLSDVFLRKYDSNGNMKWAKQLGTIKRDVAQGVAVDSLDNVFITGNTQGSLGATNAGGEDAFLFKYDSDGTLQWSTHLGTSNGEVGYSVAVDSSGNPFITGYTMTRGGSVDGDLGSFLSKFDSDGNLLWAQQLGMSGDNKSYSVAIDSADNPFIAGYTDTGGTTQIHDAFLIKFEPVPEPATLILLGVGVLGVIRRRRNP